MGTTDNFDSPADTTNRAASTIPVMSGSTARAAYITGDMVTPFNGRYRSFLDHGADDLHR